MDGKPYTAGHHAATLRRHFWCEHLGLIEAQPVDGKDDPNVQTPTVCMNDEYSSEEWDFVADPLSGRVWDLWTSQATTNTDIYRHLFRADPDNNIRTWKDYDSFAPRKTIKQGHLHDPHVPVEAVRKELDKIRGHLAWMPLDFLCEEEMAERGLQVNQYTEVSSNNHSCGCEIANAMRSECLYLSRMDHARVSEALFAMHLSPVARVSWAIGMGAESTFSILGIS